MYWEKNEYLQIRVGIVYSTQYIPLGHWYIGQSVFRGEMRLGCWVFLPFETWDRSPPIIKRQKVSVKKFLLNTFMNWSSWLLTNWLLTLIKCWTFSYFFVTFFWNLSSLGKELWLLQTYNWLHLLHCRCVIFHEK